MQSAESLQSMLSEAEACGLSQHVMVTLAAERLTKLGEQRIVQSLLVDATSTGVLI